MREASTLHSLGYAHHHLGHYSLALDCYQQSLALQRELGDRYSQAVVLTYLGDTWKLNGNIGAARGAWQQALDIIDNLHPAVGGGPAPQRLDIGQVRDLLPRPSAIVRAVEGPVEATREHDAILREVSRQCETLGADVLQG